MRAWNSGRKISLRRGARSAAAVPASADRRYRGNGARHAALWLALPGGDADERTGQDGPAHRRAFRQVPATDAAAQDRLHRPADQPAAGLWPARSIRAQGANSEIGRDTWRER